MEREGAGDLRRPLLFLGPRPARSASIILSILRNIAPDEPQRPSFLVRLVSVALRGEPLVVGRYPIHGTTLRLGRPRRGKRRSVCRWTPKDG
jgi:hypothetical protein